MSGDFGRKMGGYNPPSANQRENQEKPVGVRHQFFKKLIFLAQIPADANNHPGGSESYRQSQEQIIFFEIIHNVYFY